MTRVLIVAENEYFNDSLQKLLEREKTIALVGSAASSNEAVEKSIIYNPDLIVMCLSILNDSFYKAIRKIKDYNEKIRIWVISIERNKKILEAALKNSTDGYLMSNIDICNIFSNASNNKIEYRNIKFKYVKFKNINKLSSVKKKENKKPINYEDFYLSIHFTSREREVLKLVVEGMTNHEIANCLGISVGRARNIVAELIMKCMVKNRTQLAVIAVKMGM